MDFDSFRIQNFKGIEDLCLQLSGAPAGSIFTLVGLNESGKTTVLEAISYFDTRDRHLESLYKEEFKLGEVHDLIPMKRKANFNGAIRITATLTVSDTDKQDIIKYARTNLDFRMEPQDVGSKLRISRVIDFEASSFQRSTATWTIDLSGIPKRGQKKRPLYNFSFAKWDELTEYIRTKIPSILYFPTFLFDFPSRIYLHSDPRETPTNSYYRAIIQDILDFLGENLEIQPHIVNRVLQGSTASARALESVLTKMGNSVSKIVFESWNEIFGQKVPRKDIIVNCASEDVTIEGKPQKRVYLEFKIKDGDSLYLITERSLGFRWFFCFLLFTRFRRYRRTQADSLFLFDEPAFNLHSKAQMQLIESFDKITESKGKIIYSTHSHHMINPKWLENVYIVRNEGLHYERLDIDYDYTSRDTNIVIERYRKFVAENPDKRTYFQPILDALDYTPSNLELVPDAVIVEGKNDYYLFEYFRSVVFNNKLDINFIPGTGAGALDLVIGLYLGWGRRFILILDDDIEGREQKSRYLRDWLLPDDTVFTLRDICPEWTGKSAHKLFTAGDIRLIRERCGVQTVGGRVKKDEVVRCVQELLIQSELLSFDQETLLSFQALLTFCADRLQANSD